MTIRHKLHCHQCMESKPIRTMDGLGKNLRPCPPKPIIAIDFQLGSPGQSTPYMNVLLQAKNVANTFGSFRIDDDDVNGDEDVKGCMRVGGICEQLGQTERDVTRQQL